MWVEDNDADPCLIIGGCETVVDNGWIDKPDADIIGVNISASAGKLTTIIGSEALHNETSGDDTIFIYIGAPAGFGIGMGGGASMSTYYGTADNIGDDNLNYSGMFTVLNVTAVDTVGGSASYSYYPLDNPLNPTRPHSTTTGPAIGQQLSANIVLVEYVPIATRHKDGSIEINIDDYLFNQKYGNNRRGIVGLSFKYTPTGAILNNIWRYTHER